MRTQFKYLSLAAALLACTACESPDTEAQEDEFLDRAGAAFDARDLGSPDAGDASDGNVNPGGMCMATADLDIAGDYLMGIETSLNEGKPIMLAVGIADEGGTFEFTFQPLAKDDCPGSAGCGDFSAREEVGDSITLTGVEYASDGTITLTAAGVEVGSAANSGTGTDINADLNLTIEVCGEDFLCGDGNLVVNSLGGAELTGSFGLVRTDDVSQEAIPLAPYACDQICDFDPDNAGCDGSTGPVVVQDSYLIGIETSLNEGVPIMLFTTVSGDESGYDMTFQPLAKDDCPGGAGCGDFSARDAVGDPITLNGVTLDEDNSFSVILEGVEVGSAANSGTGTDINADINLDLQILSDTFLCGTGDLVVNSLGGAELSGTIGGIATDDPSQESVPAPAGSCSDQ